MALSPSAGRLEGTHHQSASEKDRQTDREIGRQADKRLALSHRQAEILGLLFWNLYGLCEKEELSLIHI